MRSLEDRLDLRSIHVLSVSGTGVRVANHQNTPHYSICNHPSHLRQRSTERQLTFGDVFREQFIPSLNLRRKVALEEDEDLLQQAIIRRFARVQLKTTQG